MENVAKILQKTFIICLGSVLDISDGPRTHFGQIRGGLGLPTFFIRAPKVRSGSFWNGSSVKKLYICADFCEVGTDVETLLNRKGGSEIFIFGKKN